MSDPLRYFAPEHRSLAFELYAPISNLPLICPHGHVDPRLFADPDFDSDCDVLTAGSSAYSVFYFYYDPSGDAITDDGDAYGASQWAEAGGDALSFTLPVTIRSGPAEAAADGTAGSFYGTNGYLTAPDAVAVSIADQAGNSSNVGCPE